MKSRRLLAAAVACGSLFALCVPSLAADGVRRIGGEIDINEVTAGDQFEPDVVMGPGREFMVVWSGDIPGQETDIRGRSLNWDGSPVGAEFAVNTVTAYAQNSPAAAGTSSGTFAVVWSDVAQSTSFPEVIGEVRGRLLSADGTPGTAEFSIRQVPGGLPDYFAASPSVAAVPGNEFVVVWKETPGEGGLANGEVNARTIDGEDGSPGAVFDVGPGFYWYAGKGTTSVAADAAGNFVVVYDDPYACSCSGYDADYSSGYLRRFDAQQQPLAPKQYLGHKVFLPEVAVDEEGNFVVAASGYGAFPTDRIEIRAVAPDGTPRLSNFKRIDDGSSHSRVEPDIAMTPHGDFLVVWSSRSQDGSVPDSYGVMARAFDRIAEPRGDQFVVNTTVDLNQGRPAVAIHDSGQLAITWQSSAQDGDGAGIAGQRFCMDVPLALLATGGTGGRLRVVDLESDAFVREVPLTAGEMLVEGIPPVVSRHGRWAALLTDLPAPGASRLRVVEIGSGLVKPQFYFQGLSPVAGIPPLFTQDGTQVVVAGQEPGSLAPRLQVISRVSGQITAAVDLPAGEWLRPGVGLDLLASDTLVSLVTGKNSGGGRIRLLDVATGSIISEIPMLDDEVVVEDQGPILVNDGESLLVATQDLKQSVARLRLIDAGTGLVQGQFDLGPGQSWTPRVPAVVTDDGSMAVALTSGLSPMLHIMDLDGLAIAASIPLTESEFVVPGVGPQLAGDGMQALVATDQPAGMGVRLRQVDLVVPGVTADLTVNAGAQLVEGVATALSDDHKWWLVATQGAVPTLTVVDLQLGTVAGTLNLPAGESLIPGTAIQISPESDRALIVSNAAGGEGHARVVSVPGAAVVVDEGMGVGLGFMAQAGPGTTPCAFTSLLATMPQGGGAGRLSLLDQPDQNVRAALDLQVGEQLVPGAVVVIPPSAVRADCNNNYIVDSLDLSEGTEVDCNLNGFPDSCEPDCNLNTIADACDISGGFSLDCDLNGVPDDCQADCNANGVADACDISGGFSTDCDGNKRPDDCQPELDPDLDLVPACLDNCPLTANGGQEDGDGDGAGDACDCLLGVDTAWVTPGATALLMVETMGAGVQVTWDAPVLGGGQALLYDTLRAEQSHDFLAGGSCLETGGSDTETQEGAVAQPPNSVVYYLSRAVSACAAGVGSVGQTSNATPRPATACP